MSRSSRCVSGSSGPTSMLVSARGSAARSDRSSSEPRPSSRGRAGPGERLPDDRGGGAQLAGLPAVRALGVSRSGYYDWGGRAPSDRALTDAFLIERIKEIHAHARGVYGAPRIHAELAHAHGIRVAKKRVARLMGQGRRLGAEDPRPVMRSRKTSVQVRASCRVQLDRKGRGRGCR